MGKLRKIGESTAPRSFGTGGEKLTSKTSVSNTLNKINSTYNATSTTAKKNAFDTLFEIANETAKAKLGASAPKFTLPTTGSGIVKKASSIVPMENSATQRLRRYNAQNRTYFSDIPQQTNDTFFDIDPDSITKSLEERKVQRRLESDAWNEVTSKPALFAGAIFQTLNAAAPLNIEAAKQSLSNLSETWSNPEYVKAVSKLDQAQKRLDLATQAATEEARSRFPDTPADMLGFYAEGDPEYEAAKKAVEEAQAVVDSMKVTTPIDPESSAMKSYSVAKESAERFLEGMDGWQKKAGEIGLSIGQNAAILPTALINPALPLTIMGTVSSADKIYDLSAQGVDPAEALSRGLVSGGIEALTEKIPLENVLDIARGSGLNNFLKNILKQSGIEATEESVSYAANYLADKAFQDPNATFSVQELLDNAVSGAISGGAFGVGGSVVGSSVNKANTNSQAIGNLNAQNTLRQLANQMAAERVQQVEAAASRPTATIGQNTQAVPSTASPAARMQSIMGTLGENGKAAFSNAAQQAGSVEEAYPEFSRSYSDGYTGKAETPARTPSEQAAYYAGQNDAQAERAAKPGFSESQYSTSVTKEERSFYDALGKATGTSIEITAPTGESGYNGYYANGKIQIAADAENPGMVVAAHETTHRLQETAPEAYQKFRDYAVQAVSGQDGADTLISAYQRRYAEAGIELDAEAAMDEIAADYAQDLMIDEAMIRRVVADNRTLAQKFVDAIKDLIGKVKSVFTGSEQKAQVRQLEQARDLWLNALKEVQSAQAASVETAGEAQGQPSLKGASALQRQVQNLQERNQYLKEQMKVSKGVKTDRKKTAVYAKDMLAAYESRYSADTLTSDLLGIYDEIANSRDGVDMDGLWVRAQEVAGHILEQSVREDAELYNEYASLREYLRNTKIQVPKSIHADLENIGGYNGFRKGNMGRMKLSSVEGVPIDTAYSELAQKYPGLFDEQAYTNPADQLVNISDVLDSIQPVLENPYSSEMEMATKFVANEILEGYFDVPQQKPTFADRQQARVDAAKAAGNRRLYEQRERSQQRIAQLRQQGREQTSNTVLAERMAAGRETAALKRQQNERVTKLREQQMERIAQLREQGREQVKQAIAKERLKRETQVQAIKEKYTSKDAAARERRASRDLRNKIQRHVQSLSTRLNSPTDSKNVPYTLRKPVAALLEAVNLESNYTLDPDTLHEIIRKDGKSGGLTGKRLPAGDSRGVATKRTAAFIELRKAYQDILGDESANMVIDPALLGNQAEGFQGDFDKVISMHDKRLADMTMSELETVWRTVKAVEYSISTAGKNLAKSKFAGTVEWASALLEENRGKKPRRTTQRHLTIDLLTPLTYFSRMGDSGYAVYKVLRNAQDSQQQMITDIAKEVEGIVSAKDARTMRNTTHQFITQGGQDLTLSTAQIMSLYELSKRKQAQSHLYTGGIYQPAVLGTNIRRGTEAIKLTQDDVSSIVSTLTPEQVKVADQLQSIMATTLADLGNEASMKAYGYKKFTGADYWPISVAREGVNTTVENSGDNARSISNIGLAKSVVPKASNPLNIGDAFTTFIQHVGDMTDYAAYLLPVEDLNRLYNFRYKDGEGNYTGQTVKGLLDRTAGPQSAVYWRRLMEDIQNGTAARSDSQFSESAQRLISRTKGASVGANLRVVIQQPTAYLRAAAVLDPVNLGKGLSGGVTKGSGWKKALEWAPIAQKKQSGGFEIGSGIQLEQELFGDLSKGVKRAANVANELSMALPGKADEVTWGKLWNACEWETAAKHKNLTKGSDAFYKATAELFTNVIDQSQVVDGVMQRSQVMRSNSALNKMATSFMGEPTMSLNMVMRAYDKMVKETDPKARVAARRKLARVAFSLVASGVANAAAQSLIDALRDDDKDKKYLERFLSAFTGITGEEETAWEKAAAAVLKSNIGGNLNPAGQIPYANDVLSMIQGYDVARMDAEAIGDFITAGQNVVKNIGGEGPRTPLFAVKELANAAAKVFGISVGNVLRDATGVINTVAIETDNIPLMYEIEKASYSITNSENKGRYYDILFRALSLDDFDSYKAIQSDLMNNMGVDGEDIESAMRQRLKKKGEKDPSFQLSQEAYDLIGIYERYAPKENSSSAFGADDLDAASYQSYADQSADDFRTWSNKIKGSKSFDSLPSKEKDDAIRLTRDLAESLALRDNSGGKFTNEDLSQWERWATMGKSYGVDETEAILFKIAYEMAESDKDKEGKTISGSKKENTIEYAGKIMPWLTDRELSYLMANYWTSDDNYLKSLKENKFMP